MTEQPFFIPESNVFISGPASAYSNDASSFRPGPQDYYESWMLGAVFSAIAYGIVLTMAVTCFHLLLKNPYSPTLPVRRFYYGYIISMVMLSTATMVSTIQSIASDMFKEQAMGVKLPEPSLPVKTWGAPFIALATWGADGFMMWRTYKLYLGQQETHPISKIARIFFCIFLAFLAVLSIGSGVCLIVVLVDKGWLLAIFIGVTALVNIALAVLITARLLRHQAMLRTLGILATPYKKIIAMCVESAAIMVVFNIIYLALDFEEFLGTVILINILVHVYVLSPFLIIYRVSHGNMKSLPLDEEHGSGRVTVLSSFRAASPSSLHAGRRPSRGSVMTEVSSRPVTRASQPLSLNEGAVSVHLPLSPSLRGRTGLQSASDDVAGGEVRRGSW